MLLTPDAEVGFAAGLGYRGPVCIYAAALSLRTRWSGRKDSAARRSDGFAVYSRWLSVHYLSHKRGIAMIIHGPNTEQRTIGGKAIGPVPVTGVRVAGTAFRGYPRRNLRPHLSRYRCAWATTKTPDVCPLRTGPDYPRPYPDQLAVSPAGRCGALIGWRMKTANSGLSPD